MSEQITFDFDKEELERILEQKIEKFLSEVLDEIIEDLKKENKDDKDKSQNYRYSDEGFKDFHTPLAYFNPYNLGYPHNIISAGTGFNSRKWKRVTKCLL